MIEHSTCDTRYYIDPRDDDRNYRFARMSESMPMIECYSAGPKFRWVFYVLVAAFAVFGVLVP